VSAWSALKYIKKPTKEPTKHVIAIALMVFAGNGALNKTNGPLITTSPQVNAAVKPTYLMAIKRARGRPTGVA